MTASAFSPFLEYRAVSAADTKMLDSSGPGGHQLTSVPCSSCTPTGALLDRKVGGGPSAAGLFQRSYSVSLPTDKFILSLKAESSGVVGGSDKENRFRKRSYSELGDQLRPCSQVCVGGSIQVNSSRYKTELCRPFKESGSCKYGDKCQFAHGVVELRSLSRHPKYKTELCRTFHSVGFCPYGPRCHFIHNAEERRGPPPLSAFNKERPRLQHSFSFAGFPSRGGPRDSPSSVTPPPMFSVEDLMQLQNTSTCQSQELAGPFSPSPGPPPVPEPQGLAPPPMTSEGPPSPPGSDSDQESSLGSQSGSESPPLDASHRLPIFSTLSISDD
ncbi:mRNA decay activator protein ZFP36L1-like [Embiotoca jacksoni]|uniref:mRNA decay activator protein ZFP36L1-like n=1 Tax=Embiotoca jacksoni TaxID=100190 RepID=UPI003703806E